MRKIAFHTFFVLLAVLPVVHAEPRTSIAFESYDTVMRGDAAQKRPVAVYFTASWCGSCKKMQANTLMDEAVIQASARFRWARVDIDDQPEVAASFGVRGVPALFLLDEQGKRVAARSGFLDAASMMEFLSPRGEGSAPLAAAAAKPAPLTVAQLEQALQQIAAMRPEERTPLREQILQLKAAAWPGLFAGMRSPHLAVRAAAYDLLRESSNESHPYDPFAAKAERDAAVSKWQGRH